MSRFSDLMNKPLPSATERAFRQFMEAGDEEDMNDFDTKTQDTPEETEACSRENSCGEEHYHDDDDYYDHHHHCHHDDYDHDHCHDHCHDHHHHHDDYDHDHCHDHCHDHHHHYHDYPDDHDHIHYHEYDDDYDDDDDEELEACSREGCAREGSCRESDDFSDPESDVNSIASDIGYDDDIDDLSDDELSALDAELTSDQINQISIDGNDEEVQLTPDEQQEADDMMGIAATTVLINDEMNNSEKKKFLESASDIQAAVNEGLLLESDINELATTLGLITEANNYNKKMIIRLDKEAKQKQLYAIAINVSAAAHHDPDYIKLKKINRMRKILRAKLEKKYHAEATKRMKVYYKRLVSSGSAPLAAIGKNIEKGK